MRWNIQCIEIGIDRIWFEFTGGVLYVSGTQIKSGGSATQRVDDTTIAGIIVKAERRFDAQVFQGPIQIKELVTLTNQDARRIQKALDCKRQPLCLKNVLLRQMIAMPFILYVA